MKVVYIKKEMKKYLKLNEINIEWQRSNIEATENLFLFAVLAISVLFYYFLFSIEAIFWVLHS